MSVDRDFYLRYYVGHKGKFGHEFLEFEFRPDGKLRYANNSNYKNDTMIRKEAYVHKGRFKCGIDHHSRASGILIFGTAICFYHWLCLISLILPKFSSC